MDSCLEPSNDQLNSNKVGSVTVESLNYAILSDGIYIRFIMKSGAVYRVKVDSTETE